MKTNLNLGNPPTPAIGFPESLKSNYKDRIDSFLSSIEEDIKSATPYETIETLSALSELKDFFPFNVWQCYTYQMLERMRNEIYNGNYSIFPSFGGITDILFVIREFSYTIPGLTRFLQSLNKMQAQQILKLLDIYETPNYLIHNHFELISGVAGPLRYWLDVDSEEALELSKRMSKFLVRNSVSKEIDSCKVPGWHYYPLPHEARYMTEVSPNGYINYSVSHGMGGPLMSLSYSYYKGIRVDGLLETIQDLIDEYKNSYYRATDIIYWPGRISFEQYINQSELRRVPARMSWCYGSVGILRVLFLSAQYLSDKKLERWALDELIKIAKMENKDYLFDSPIVCHGYAGVALIMNEMYRDTLNPVFREKTISLLELIDQILNDPQVTKELKRYSYLEGYSGIFQTAMSIFNGTQSENLKRLLII